MDKVKILWVDDEIELLKPHIIFLQSKGYEVNTTNNGTDAIEIMSKDNFDIIFLDEQMPGISGIETLEKMKQIKPLVPIVMITKSEEENLMENAIGSNIADYLIKPVNPNQILLSLKKNLDNKKLIDETSTMKYQQEFRQIGMDMSYVNTFEEWAEVYKKLVTWELRLGASNNEMFDIFLTQKHEANNLFSKFVEKNYVDWLHDKSKRPDMVHLALQDYVFPEIKTTPVFLVVVDNMRYDQWKVIERNIDGMFRTDSEHLVSSILPTTTQYARNALFAGLLPSEIQKTYPKYWLNEEDEGTKNQYEEFFLGENLKRHGLNNIKFSYNKILNLPAGKKLVETLPNLMVNNLNVVVYNFVDMLSHARTEMEIIKELANDEAAYRSLTESWFEHSALYDIFEYLSKQGATVIVTTDHGSVKVEGPVKVIGEKNTNTNLRYKVGKNLDYNKKEVMEIRKPEDIYLPRTNISTSYIFARGNDFFAYPNNYNYYVSYYKNTFQHGGISLEEMIIPIAILKAK